jgi:feruloyl-CoA synthase
MPCRQGLDPHQRFLTRAGQVKRVRAAIAIGRSVGAISRRLRTVFGTPGGVGEMTDKGSINQRAVLNRRAALVAELYCPSPSARIISIAVHT